MTFASVSRDESRRTAVQSVLSIAGLACRNFAKIASRGVSFVGRLVYFYTLVLLPQAERGSELANDVLYGSLYLICAGRASCQNVPQHDAAAPALCCSLCGGRGRRCAGAGHSATSGTTGRSAAASAELPHDVGLAVGGAVWRQGRRRHGRHGGDPGWPDCARDDEQQDAVLS